MKREGQSLFGLKQPQPHTPPHLHSLTHTQTFPHTHTLNPCRCSEETVLAHGLNYLSVRLCFLPRVLRWAVRRFCVVLNFLLTPPSPPSTSTSLCLCPLTQQPSLRAETLSSPTRPCFALLPSRPLRDVAFLPVFAQRRWFADIFLDRLSKGGCNV